MFVFREAGGSENTAINSGKEQAQASSSSRHPATILKVSVPTPFGWYYINIRFGQERRSVDRLIEEGQLSVKKVSADLHPGSMGPLWLHLPWRDGRHLSDEVRSGHRSFSWYFVSAQFHLLAGDQATRRRRLTGVSDTGLSGNGGRCPRVGQHLADEDRRRAPLRIEVGDQVRRHLQDGGDAAQNAERSGRARRTGRPCRTGAILVGWRRMALCKLLSLVCAS